MNRHLPYWMETIVGWLPLSWRHAVCRRFGHLLLYTDGFGVGGGQTTRDRGEFCVRCDYSLENYSVTERKVFKSRGADMIIFDEFDETQQPPEVKP